MILADRRRRSVPLHDGRARLSANMAEIYPVLAGTGESQFAIVPHVLRIWESYLPR